MPMYYTSQALRGAEEGYLPMEKIVFALIIVACKLRPYFPSHTTVLQMDKLFQKAMDNPKAVGRLVLWAIELNEFDIQYCPRTAIKAQALADFIAKFTTNKTND